MRYPFGVRIGGFRHVVLLALGGCLPSITDLIPSESPSPGGTVQVAMNGGAMKTTTALVSAAKDPLHIDGVSVDLTLSLTAGDATAGVTAQSVLIQPNMTVQIELSTQTRSQLEVHLSQTGCVATEGTIHLSTNDKMLVSGDFQAAGTVAGKSDTCTIAGTLKDVPLTK